MSVLGWLFGGKNYEKERTARLQIRQNERTERSENRTNTRSVAYMTGNDPNGWIASSINSVANVAGGLLGFGPNGQPIISPQNNGSELSISGSGSSSNLLLYIGGALLALFLLFKRKR